MDTVSRRFKGLRFLGGSPGFLGGYDIMNLRSAGEAKPGTSAHEGPNPSSPGTPCRHEQIIARG